MTPQEFRAHVENHYHMSAVRVEARDEVNKQERYTVFIMRPNGKTSTFLVGVNDCDTWRDVDTAIRVAMRVAA